MNSVNKLTTDVIDQMVQPQQQNLRILVLVSSSSFFFWSNTASEEFAAHQWILHRQGWQVLDENVHIGEAQENVGTEDIWEKMQYVKRLVLNPYGNCNVYVSVQFHSSFNFYFPLFLFLLIYDKEYETKENKNWTKDKIKLQHNYTAHFSTCITCSNYSMLYNS